MAKNIIYAKEVEDQCAGSIGLGQKLASPLLVAIQKCDRDVSY